VAEKENGKNAVNSHNSSPPLPVPEQWRRWYRIPQFMGVAVLPASTYFAVKKCDESIMGFIVTKSISIFWFAPMAVLPYFFSVLVTLFLRGRLGERPGTARQIHVALGTVWTITLIFVVLLLESTLIGNRSQITMPMNTSESGGWTLGQILPLALSITPAWPFANHIITHLRQIDFKAFLEQYTSFSWLERRNDEIIQDSEFLPAQSNIISPADEQSVTNAYKLDVIERVETQSSGFFYKCPQYCHHGWTFCQYRRRKHNKCHGLPTRCRRGCWPCQCVTAGDLGHFRTASYLSIISSTIHLHSRVS